MAMSKWLKQAGALASEHADKINAGIDSAAGQAKKKAPSKGGAIDKAAGYAKKAVDSQKKRG
jgi:hypothetical protein